MVSSLLLKTEVNNDLASAYELNLDDYNIERLNNHSLSSVLLYYSETDFNFDWVCPIS